MQHSGGCSSTSHSPSVVELSGIRVRAPSKYDAGITAAAYIRRQLAGNNQTPIPNQTPSPIDLSADAARGRQQNTTDDALARRIRGKCADGDIRAALRILTSDDTFVEPDADVIAELQDKHPAAPEDEQLPPPPSPSDPAPLTVTPKGLATLCVQSAQCRTRSSEIAFLRSLKIVQLIGNTRTESHYDSTQKRNLGRTRPRLRT